MIEITREAPSAVSILLADDVPASKPRTASTCQASGLYEINVCSHCGMVAGSAKMLDKNTRGIRMSHPKDITAEALRMVSPIIINIHDTLMAKKIIIIKEIM